MYVLLKRFVMRHKHKIIHVIQVSGLCWDLLYKRWNVWPKGPVGAGCRYFFSAKRARREFEKFRKTAGPSPVSWTTYSNKKAEKRRTAGYWSYPLRPILDLSDEEIRTGLNSLANHGWWLAALSKMDPELRAAIP